MKHLARRRTILLLALAVLIAGFAAVGFAIRSWRLPERFAVVEPGVLYRSAQPYPAQIANLAKGYGIKTLLVTRPENSRQVENEIAAAKEHGLTVVRIPIESRAAITEEQVRQFLRCVDDPRLRPILVHCSAGRHRTGYLCGVYRIERQGWSVERAVEEMLSFGAAEDGDHPTIEQLKQYKPAAIASSPLPPPLDK